MTRWRNFVLYSVWFRGDLNLGLGILRVASYEVRGASNGKFTNCSLSFQSIRFESLLLRKTWGTSSLWLGKKALSNDHVLAVRLDKKFKNRADAFCSWASGVRRSASWFFSRDEGMMNAGFALSLVTGKGSNVWVLNGIYLKMLITTYINHAFFFFC